MSNFTLEKLNDFAKANFIPIMNDQTRQVLENAVFDSQPKTILEIGTAIGYSGIIMLNASPNAQLFTIDFNEDSLKMAKDNFKNAGVFDRVHFFVGDAREIVTKLTGSYDFIFLDGPKGQYSNFLPYLLDILNVGGTLVCDNILYKGLVENVPQNRHKHITIARNLNKFLNQLQQNPELSTQILHIADGISISKKVE